MRALALILLLLAGCRATAPSEPSAPAPSPEPAANPQMDEAQWRAEAQLLLYERHMALAKQYRDALDPDKALEHVDQALMLQPKSDEATRLKIELQRMTGRRSGEVATMLDDEWLARQARDEQRVVESQRLLAEARRAEEAGNFEEAMTLYKRAAYLAKGK